MTRIEKASLNIVETDDPSIIIITGRATEDDTTVINDKKTWYPFEVRWNIRRNASELASLIEIVLEEQKPKTGLTTLLSTLVSANPAIVDMSGEVTQTGATS